MDDPTLFISDLQDASKNIFSVLIGFEGIILKNKKS
jgi:hypothetical protein